MASKPKWKEKGVPYDENSKSYVTYPKHDSVWRPADEFYEELVIDSSERGLSAATVWMISVTGVSYPMFFRDFVDLVSNYEHVQNNAGIYDRKWEWVKKGSNYGIRVMW